VPGAAFYFLTPHTVIARSNCRKPAIALKKRRKMPNAQSDTSRMISSNRRPLGIALADGTFGSGGSGDTINKLKEGIERLTITEINNPAGSALAQSTIPVVSNLMGTAPALYNHIPGGSNILYMDGHVEFVKYPGKDFSSPAMAHVVGAAG
jgi:prepilin-type processing-associated H-X9-DG protein